MKKTLGLLLSVIVCGAILTACNTEETPGETISETTTVFETTPVSEATTVSETTTVFETTTVCESTTSFDSRLSDSPPDLYSKLYDKGFNSIADGGKFNDDGVNCKEISLTESKTYALIQEFKNKSPYYISAIDFKLNKHCSNTIIQAAVKDKDMALIRDGDVSNYVYIHDMKRTDYCTNGYVATSETLDQQSYDEYNMLASVINYYIPADTDEASYPVESYTFEIDGSSYTYEFIEYSQNDTSFWYFYIYDDKNNFRMSGNADFWLTIIYEIDDNIPPDIFVQPTGYNITDLNAENE